MAIKVRQGGAWIDVTGGDDNTTYTLPLTGATGGSSVGSAKWTLDASTGTDTSVTLNPGSNINISAITTSGNDRSFTLEATNTTYDYLLVDHGSSTGSGTGNDSILRLDPSTGTNDDIRLIAGTNVSFSPDTSAGTLTIAATPGGVTTFLGLTDTPGSYSGQDGKLVKVNSTPNGLEFADETTYELKCTRDADGGSTGTDGDPYLFLDASSGTDDSVQVVGANGISVTRNDDSQLTIDGSALNGTTYTLPVFGTGNGSSGLRLTGSDSSTDDVNVTGSGGITVIGSGTDTLTISGSGVAGTKYDYVLVDHGSSTGSGSGNDSILRLDGDTASGNTDDDIRLIAGTNVTFTPDTSAGTLTIAAAGGGISGVTKVAQLWDEKTQNTDGGTFTSGAWRDRTLNTETDPQSFVTLDGGNVYFSLSAGTYAIEWSAPAHAVDQHQTKLLYADNSSFTSPSEILGSSENSSDPILENDKLVQSRSFGSTTLTITGTTYFKIQHRCTDTRADTGLGVACDFTSTNEVYTQVKIEDLATAVKDGLGGITIKDEGSALATLATTLNFVGSGVVASGTGAEKTITISGGTNTKYDYLLVDHGSSTGAGSGNDSILRLDGDTASGNTDDDIRLIAGSNVTFTPNTGANTLTIAASGGASGPTYTLPLTGSTGSSGSATWTLTPSSGPSNAVKLNAGTNVSISSLDTTGPDYEFTIDVASAGGLTLDTTVTDVLDLTGGTLGADDAGADRIIFWDESATKLTHLTVGSGLNITGTTITATGGGSEDEYVDAVSFNTSNGILTLARTIGGDLTVDLDGRYVQGAQDEYVDGVSFNTGNGILTLARNVGGDLTVDLDGRYAEGNTKYDLEVPAGTTKIRLAGDTASGNTNDDIELVGGTNVDITRNSSTQLTIDFDTAGFALDKIIEGDTKAEVVDSGSNGHFLVEIDGTERFRVENNGNTLLKRTDTSLEGGHLQFEDSQGVQSFALDVYGSTSLGSSLRVVDQISTVQRFAINRYGAIALTTSGNYGSAGQVLTSNEATGEAYWGDGGGPGSAVCYGYLSGTSGGGAGTIAGTSYNIANHSGGFGSHDNFNDNYDGGIVINLTTGTGSSNYPVVVSGYSTMSGTDHNSNNPNALTQMTTLHAYDITSTSFKLQGRLNVYYGGDSSVTAIRYPDRISFAGFKN